VNDIEVLIGLLALAAVLVRLADVAGIPYPILLVVGGLAIGFVPDGPEIELAPEVLFLVFLPPLLQSGAYYSSPQELRAEGGPLGGLVVGLPLLTMAAVALAAHLAVPDLGWAEALVVGAILAPTDPLAAIVTFTRVRVPDRVALLVRGESMVNDATALVAYKIALAAVVTGTYTAAEGGLDLLIAVAGGIAIGFMVAAISVSAIRRLRDVPLVILLSVLMGYVAFALAEEVEASGVLAVVTAGLYLGWRAPAVMDADQRLNAAAFWQVLVLALNATLFVLLGMQFPEVLERVGEELSVGQMIGYGLLVSAVVAGVRIAWQFVPLWLGGRVPALGAIATASNWREALLVGWPGMRGAVSLAAALALPLELESGAPFGDRDLIIFLTAAVIIFTLVFQGLTLKPLAAVLGSGTSPPAAPDEGLARLAAAQAALDRLDELEAGADPVPDAAIARLRELYQARFARGVASLSGGEVMVPIENPLQGYRRWRRELIAHERRALLQLRAEGKLTADVYQRIERDLDLDEARLDS